MSLILPSLQKTPFQKIDVACYLRGISQADSDYLQQCKHGTVSDSQACWVTDSYGSFLDSDKNLMGFSELSISKAEPSTWSPSTTLNDIESRFEWILGKGVLVTCGGDLRVSLANLRESGKIGAMLGVSTESSGIGLELTGAKFRVSGSTAYEFSWYIEPSGENGERDIAVHLESRIPDCDVASDNILKMAFDALKPAYEFLVLDENPDPSIVVMPSTSE